MDGLFFLSERGCLLYPLLQSLDSLRNDPLWTFMKSVKDVPDDGVMNIEA